MSKRFVTAEPWGVQKAPTAALVPAETPPLRQLLLKGLTDAVGQLGGREAMLAAAIVPLAQRKLAEHTDEQLASMLVQAHSHLTDYLRRAGLI